MASRVVLPSRGFAFGLWVGAIFVVVICTNRSVQKATPYITPRQVDRLAMPSPPTDEASSRAGTGFLGRAEPPRGLRGPFEAPLLIKSKERTGDAERGHHDGRGIDAEGDDTEHAQKQGHCQCGGNR